MSATTVIPNDKDAFVNRMKFFAREGNLSEANFFELDHLLAEINFELRQGTLTEQDIKELRNCFDADFLHSTLHGMGLIKPNGYAGDFLLLDRIYTKHITDNVKYGIWDAYFQQHAAPRAVRERKGYFKNMVLTKINRTPSLDLLNVVSGSARELYELYQLLPASQDLRTTCVELDDKAIRHAKNLNMDFLDRIQFTHSNIFKFKTESKFDMIWSAGLFDYLDDKSFVMLLKKFGTWLKKGGEIVVGNYNEEHNPSRNYMEILGDWYLVHRTAEELMELAVQAGFATENVRVGREKSDVILFLHVRA